MAQITLDEVDKVYSGRVKAVNGLSLEIGDGEFMVLVGPSGCGKSTALRIIAGLEEVSHGTIRIGDRVVNGVPPKDRDIAMIFQNYALYPQMTVAQNLAFGLRMRKTPKQEIERRVRNAASILGLEPYLAAPAGGAVRRPAPARGDGPGDRAGAAGFPHGRTAVEPRRQAPGRRAGIAGRAT